MARVRIHRFTISNSGGVRSIKRTVAELPDDQRVKRDPTIHPGGNWGGVRAKEIWPAIIKLNPRTMANAMICEECEHVGKTGCGLHFCRLEPGEPNHRRLYSIVIKGDCRKGKHARDPGAVAQ